MKWTLIFVISAGTLAQEQTGSLQGTVTDSITHMPVRKARVSLFPQGPMRRPMLARRGGAGGSATTTIYDRPEMPTVQTDASGSFVLSGLEPGPYGVTVDHSSYPSRASMRPQMTTVQVTAGGEPARLAVELTPGATVTGRVVDEDGDPIQDCYVQVMAPPSRGPNQYIGALGSQPSNDQGVYRVYGIAGSKVQVSANCPRPPFQPRPLLPYTAPPPPPALAYLPQFYPGVMDASGAQTIELAPGSVREGVDFRMTPVRVYTVKGTIRVLPGASRPERDNSYVMVARRDVPVDSPARMMNQRGGPIDWSKGTFEIQAVAPGAYTLAAPGSGIQADVDVVDRPVELTVDLRPPIELRGSIVVEGETRTPMNRLSLQFVPEDRMSGGFGGFQPKEDGSFTAVGLIPTRYSLRVSSAEMFVKSVTLGGEDAPGGVIDLRNGGAEIRVILSTRTATIAGKAPPGRMVQVMNTAEAFFGSRVVMSDEQGTFTMGQLAPGKYKITLDGTSDDAQDVTVAEGETVNVELKAPAEN